MGSGQVISLFAFLLVGMVAPAVLKMPVWLSLPFRVYIVLLVVAFALLNSPNRKKQLKTHLGHDSYALLYSYALSLCINGFQRLLSGEIPRNLPKDLRSSIRSTFNFQMLDRALLVAVIYPLLFMVIYWSMGVNTGKIGDIAIFESDDRWWFRLLVVLGLLAMSTLLMFESIVRLCGNEWVIKNSENILTTLLLSGAAIGGLLGYGLGIKFNGVTSFFGFLAVGIGLLSKGHSPSILALGLIGAYVLGTAITNSGTFTSHWLTFGPLAVFYAAIYALDRLVVSGRSNWRYVAYFAFIPVGIIASALLLDPSNTDRVFLVVCVFGLVVPYINGLFDALSYGTTISLARMGLARPSQAILWAALDIALAMAFLVGIGVVLVVSIVGINRLADFAILDIRSFLESLDGNPDNYWIYAMAATTLLPTLVHLVIATFSFQAVFNVKLRKRVLDSSKNLDPDGLMALLLPMLFAFIWWLSMVVPVGVLYGLGLLVSPWIAEVALAYKALLIGLTDALSGLR